MEFKHRNNNNNKDRLGITSSSCMFAEPNVGLLPRDQYCNACKNENCTNLFVLIGNIRASDDILIAIFYQSLAQIVLETNTQLCCKVHSNQALINSPSRYCSFLSCVCFIYFQTHASLLFLSVFESILVKEM